jgi:hypothetical protein
VSGASTEQEIKPEPTEQEQSAAITASAFASTFDSDDEDDGQPTETPAVPEPTPAPTPTSTPAPTAAPVAPEYVQIQRGEWERVSKSAAKIDEIEATFGKIRDQAFGKIGGLERTIAELQKATPQGAAVELTDDDFADMKAQYPELADYTRKAFEKVMGRLKGTGGKPIDAEAITKMVTEQIEPVRRELAGTTLAAVFPTWKKDVNGEEFGKWIAGQPGGSLVLVGRTAVDAAMADENSPLRKFIATNPESAVARYVSSDVGDAAALMRDYYGQRQAAAPSPTPAPTAAPKPATTPAQPSMRSRQMAAAVAPPKDGGSPPPTRAKSPFEQGFEEED